MRTEGGFELTYCSNIHPADGWRQVLAKLRQIPPELKRRISPQERFGIGLRLSNAEAAQLLDGGNLEELRHFFREEGLYVALLNGFPYAGFHDCCLKDQVFAPDWHTAERVEYTLRLVEILGGLLPENLEGGISTSPLSYKRWQQAPRWDVLIANVMRVVQAMMTVKLRDGRLLHLDIEPEPDGLLENTREFLDFYGMLLLQGCAILQRESGLSRQGAEDAIREHIAICYDVCHFAVEHEEPAATIGALRAAGVRLGRAQISSAVRVAIPELLKDREALRNDLAELADSTYLHQVIGEEERFADLLDALPRVSGAESSEWRIHYHVPLFMEHYGRLSSTQAEVRSALTLLTPDLVKHLEIETYTWGVLPADLKMDIVDSIEREYRWVLDKL
jgi:hypothetical protein